MLIMLFISMIKSISVKIVWVVYDCMDVLSYYIVYWSYGCLYEFIIFHVLY